MNLIEDKTLLKLSCKFSDKVSSLVYDGIEYSTQRKRFKVLESPTWKKGQYLCFPVKNLKTGECLYFTYELGERK